MKTTAIVQARMGSSRLPGKILMPLAGKPALAHLVERLSFSKNIDHIVIATTTDACDDVVEAFCKRTAVDVFRGSELDVLDRYYQTATAVAADPIVRVTADCPVIDPLVLDEVIEGYFAGGYDVYGLDGEFPDGLDCTVFSYETLAKTWRDAKLPSEREHVGPYMVNHPELFKIGGHIKYQGLSHHRWTLDEPRDLQFLEQIYNRLYQPGEIFTTQDILALLAREPNLSAINSDIVRNAGYAKSLREDQDYLQKTETA